VIAWAVPPDDAPVAAWPELPRLLVQAARAVVAPASAGPLAAARVVHERGEDALRISLPEGESAAALARAVVARRGPDGDVPAVFSGVEDGEAVFRLPPLPPGATHGVVLLRAPREAEDAEDAKALGALPPLAYLPRGGAPAEEASDPARLAATFGPAPAGPETWAVPRRTVPERRPLWPYLLAGALVLLPVDAALHRRSRPTLAPARGAA
jgi:hypothetical protein